MEAHDIPLVEPKLPPEGEGPPATKPVLTPLVIPDGVDDNEFSLSDLYHPQSKYTPVQKMSAVMGMVMTGNKSVDAAKMSGIPAPTIRWWKMQAIWWPSAVERCKRAKNDEIDGAMTRVIDLGMKNVEQMLTHGEDVVLKDGSIGTKRPSARDQTIIVATLQDKRNIIRGEPTNITRRNESELLQELCTQFSNLSKQIRNQNVVSEQ